MIRMAMLVDTEGKRDHVKAMGNVKKKLEMIVGHVHAYCCDLGFYDTIYRFCESPKSHPMDKLGHLEYSRKGARKYVKN
jgi:hypothetical protein